jgi:hypothetical protein
VIYFQRFGYFLCVVFWDFLFAAAMETDRKIIIAVDDSETSAYAFTWALHHLLKKSDKVIVLTAAPFVTLDFPSTDIASDYGVTAVQSPRDAAAAEKNVNEGAKDLIAKYVKLCAQSEVSHKRSSYFFHNLVRVKCGCFTHALSRRIA